MKVAVLHVIGIDVSTKTGLVALDHDGKVADARELELESVPVGSGPGARMVRLMEFQRLIQVALVSRITKLAVIEGYSHASKFNNYVQTELGVAVRMACYRASVPFVEVSPSTLKKFATGVGKGDKSLIRLGVYKRWGFEHASDNVVDAYVLARIGLCAVGAAKMVNHEREIVGKLKRAAP